MESRRVNDLDKAGIESANNSKDASIIRTLTANDIAFWGADAFISVALALFVVSTIEGATVLNVGIALMIHRVTGSLLAVPIGRFFDKHKGYLDEVWGLWLACFLAGLIYMALSFSTAIWQLYLAMFLLGGTSILNLTSWRILFYNSIDKERFGQTTGVYQMLFSFGIGLALVVGGFAGDRFGYQSVLLIGGMVMAAGSFLPLMLRGYIEEK